MEKKALTPISFLKSKEMRQKYQCGICTEVCVKPVRCRGSCSRIYCMKCVSDWRQTKDQCPLKCSSPFLVLPMPDIQLEFACPYNPTGCHTNITSVKQFEQHHLSCPFVPQEQVLRKQYQRQYKCLNGHQLEFFIGSYEEMLESQCQECQEVRLCRSYCRICDHLYCVTCRMPPCSKEDCPIGHKYNFQHIANLNYICDLCGISTSVSNGGVYDDTYCNFGICEACYQELPEHFDASKPRQLIANINTRCCCGQLLKPIDSIHTKRQCELCKKIKECPRFCKRCTKFYCMRCKMMDIENDNTCCYEHQLDVINLLNFTPDVQQQNQYGCMRCLKVQSQYYFDRHCRIRLCEECFVYCKRVTADKKRCVIMKCDINHVLTYIGGPEDVFDTCSQCHKQKIIKLRCMYCQEQHQGEIRQKSYCFECRPIKLDTCYYKHKLRLAKFEGQRECHFCCRNFNEFYYCRKCYFYVCRECMGLNEKKFQDEMEEEPLSNEEQVKQIKAEPHKMEEEI